MKKIFKAAKGAHFTDEQAQRYGEYIAKIADINGGVLPDDLVDQRLDPEISDYFTQDTDEAAYKHWKWQAYNLLGNINLLIDTPDGIRETRAFHPVTVIVEEIRKPKEEPITVVARIYRNKEDILQDPDQRAQIVYDALERFRAMRDRYKELKELSAIFDAIDKVKV